MTDQIKYCKVCTKRKHDFQVGIVCGLTDKKPVFTGKCPDFVLDERESARKHQLEMNAAGDSERGHSSTDPQLNITIGVIVLVVGSLLTLYSFVETLGGGSVIAYGSIIYGIFSIIRGTQQKKIIEEKEVFEKEISEK